MNDSKTQEAIYNSLFMSEGMEGRDGNKAGPLPVNRVISLLKDHGLHGHER